MSFQSKDFESLNNCLQKTVGFYLRTKTSQLSSSLRTNMEEAEQPWELGQNKAKYKIYKQKLSLMEGSNFSSQILCKKRTILISCLTIKTLTSWPPCQSFRSSLIKTHSQKQCPYHCLCLLTSLPYLMRLTIKHINKYTIDLHSKTSTLNWMSFWPLDSLRASPWMSSWRRLR